MISRYLEKNSFGGDTYIIEVQKLFKIILEDDTNDNLIVKTYKRNFFLNKLLYSFTHEKDWEVVIPLVYKKLVDHIFTKEASYYKDHFSKYPWDEDINHCLDVAKSFYNK